MEIGLSSRNPNSHLAYDSEMTDDWAMTVYSHAHSGYGSRSALWLSLALSPIFALTSETPLQGPFKDPFEWPTYWMVENLITGQSSVTTADPKGMARLRREEPDPSDPRVQRFMNRLGALSPAHWDAPLIETPSGGNTSDGFGGVQTRHWLKADLLAHAPFLGEMHDGHLRKGEVRISYHASNESEILQTYDKIGLNKGQADGITLGQEFQLYEVGDPGYAYSSTRTIGRQIIPNGIAKVVSVKEHSATARLTTCFGTISRATRASPLILEDGRYPVQGYAPVSGEKPLARVVWIPGSNQLPMPFNYAILDKGVEAGFRLGDHVMLFNQRSGKMTDRLLGEGLVVHIESQSATVLVHDVFPGVINAGDFATSVQTPRQ